MNLRKLSYNFFDITPSHQLTILFHMVNLIGHVKKQQHRYEVNNDVPVIYRRVLGYNLDNYQHQRYYTANEV